MEKQVGSEPRPYVYKCNFRFVREKFPFSCEYLQVVNVHYDCSGTLSPECELLLPGLFFCKKPDYPQRNCEHQVRRTFELPFDVEVTPVTETFECKENFPDKEIEIVG